MVARLVIVPEVLIKRLLQVMSILERGEVDTLVFNAAPEPFHENIIMLAALSVHADSDAVLIENACEGFAGELGPYQC